MKERIEMLLADIGNTHIHIYDGREVLHLLPNEAIERYSSLDMNYITVNNRLDERIAEETMWRNINPHIKLRGAYDTMGVDRQALCLSYLSGLFVDAGTAITVDLVEEGVYRGGFILPGLSSLRNAYAEISPVLDVGLNRKVLLDRLPHTTRDGISYGIIASIKTVIEKHREKQKIYCSGGDGRFFSSLFEGSIFDDSLVFRGIINALRASGE